MKELFAASGHLYTQGLIGLIPILGVVKDALEVILGSVPNIVSLPQGCRSAALQGPFRAQLEHLRRCELRIARRLAQALR